MTVAAGLRPRRYAYTTSSRGGTTGRSSDRPLSTARPTRAAPTACRDRGSRAPRARASGSRPLRPGNALQLRLARRLDDVDREPLRAALLRLRHLLQHDRRADAIVGL